jgi:hypothetical protein
MEPAHVTGLVLAAAVGLVLGACGGTTSGTNTVTTTTGSGTRAVVPPIKAVDRALRASAFGRDVPFLRNGCVEIQVGPGVGPPPRCRPSVDFLAGLPLGPQALVHVLAELPLHRPQGLSQRALFAVYESRARGTCFSIVFEVALDPLTCDTVPGCSGACLQPFVEERAARLGVEATGRYTLMAGTVPAAARGVRFRFRDGAAVTYALRGPAARGFPGRRIFLADLGRRPTPARVELVP